MPTYEPASIGSRGGALVGRGLVGWGGARCGGAGLGGAGQIQVLSVPSAAYSNKGLERRRASKPHTSLWTVCAEEQTHQACQSLSCLSTHGKALKLEDRY